MKLVEDWKQSWRWLSIRAMTAATALQGAYLSIPPDMQSLVPADWVSKITIAILVLGAIGRLVDQPAVLEKKHAE